MNNVPLKLRRPWVALFLGLLMPGLGQIYNGYLAQGVIFLFSYVAVVIFVYIAWAYLLPFFSLFMVWRLLAFIGYWGIAIHAYRQNRSMPFYEAAKWYSKAYGLVLILLLGFLIAFSLAATARYFVQAFNIPSGAMIPTITIGDHVLVKKAYYGIKLPFSDQFMFYFSSPQRGDIVVFKYPDDEKKDFIKRVIGVPGDRIEIADKQVSVNGTVLKEPYVIHQDPSVFSRGVQPRDNFGPIVVPEGSYFVMGDNRDQSLDSRFWGFVNRNKIKGKAFLIYWSFDKRLNRVRWDRLGSVL